MQTPSAYHWSQDYSYAIRMRERVRRKVTERDRDKGFSFSTARESVARLVSFSSAATKRPTLTYATLDIGRIETGCCSVDRGVMCTEFPASDAFRLSMLVASMGFAGEFSIGILVFDRDFGFR